MFYSIKVKEDKKADGEIRSIGYWIVQGVYLSDNSSKRQHDEAKKNENHESNPFEKAFLEAVARTV